MRRIPLWLKIGWTAWVALWAPAYALHFGPENYMWFCNLANFAVAAALWTESSLLISWQAVSVLLVMILYDIDVIVRFFFGFFPIGGTRFMFDGGIPLEIRLLSLCMHVATPPVLIWGLARLGYDRRAFPLQAATAAAMIAISWLGGPDRNINWSWGPLFREQQVVPPTLYIGVAAVGYALILYLPSHLFFSRVWPRSRVKLCMPNGVDNSC